MEKPNNEEKQSKEDTILDCPSCEEHNMRWDKENRIWQCLSCGYRREE